MVWKAPVLMFKYRLSMVTDHLDPPNRLVLIPWLLIEISAKVWI